MKNKNRLAREAAAKKFSNDGVFFGDPREFWREIEKDGDDKIRSVGVSGLIFDDPNGMTYEEIKAEVAKQYPDGNPKDAVGRRKVPLSLIPSSALIHEAQAFKYGAFEAPCVDGKLGYGPYNWRTAPVSATVYLDAMIRHVLDYIDGEDYADDSKAHHLGHARACAAIILDAAENGTLIDDRPAKGKASEILKRFTRKS